MVVLIIVAALLLIMGIIILIGKGDNLIAGYNTASQKREGSVQCQAPARPHRRSSDCTGSYDVPPEWREHDGGDVVFRGSCICDVHRCGNLS